MAAIIVLVVVPLVPATIIPALVTAIIPAVTMLFLVTRDILAVVPVVLHKVDPLAAGVVFAAVLAPMFGVARRYAQIDGRAAHWYPLDYSRLMIDYLWLRIAADVESAIEAGLADADGNTDIVRECRGGDGGSNYRRCDQKTFHFESPVVSGC